ncbi:MAG: hypothetical protein ABIH41_04550 [Nanoarchaeota archaeon]
MRTIIAALALIVILTGCTGLLSGIQDGFKGLMRDNPDDTPSIEPNGGCTDNACLDAALKTCTPASGPYTSDNRIADIRIEGVHGPYCIITVDEKRTCYLLLGSSMDINDEGTCTGTTSIAASTSQFAEEGMTITNPVYSLPSKAVQFQVTNGPKIIYLKNASVTGPLYDCGITHKNPIRIERKAAIPFEIMCESSIEHLGYSTVTVTMTYYADATFENPLNIQGTMGISIT